MILELLLVCVIVGIFSQTDPECTAGEAYPYADAVACIESVPFAEAEGTEINDVLQVFYHMNPYHAMASSQNPVQPAFPVSGVDGFHELQVAYETEHNNVAYSFHKSIQNSFRKLRDVHTRYIPPRMFSGWVFILPFTIRRECTQFGDNTTSFYDCRWYPTRFDQTEIEGIPNNPSIPWFYGNAGVGGGDYRMINETKKWITSIDQEDPHQYFLNMVANSDECAYSRHPSTCYNHQVKNFGVRSLAVHSFPRPATVEIVIENDDNNSTETLTLEWVGVKVGTDKLAEEMNRNSLVTDWAKYYTTRMKRIHATETAPSRRASVLDEDVDLISFEEVALPGGADGEKMLVIRVKSFMRDEVLRFANHLGKNWGAADWENIKRVIVDVRDVDTEGHYCSAYLLARYVSAYSPKDPNPIMDAAENALLNSIHCNYVSLAYQWAEHYNLERKPVGRDWVLKGHDRVRGNATSTPYSALVHYQCDLMYKTKFQFGTNYWTNIPKRKPSTFEPDQIFIVSDGTCGSTCFLFVHLMKNLGLARIVTMGGADENSPPMIAAFGGSIHTSLEQALRYYKITSVVCKGVENFAELPNDAVMTMVEFEIYPWLPKKGAFALKENLAFTDLGTLPMDWRVELGDYNMFRHDFFSDEIITDLVSTFPDDSCLPGEIRNNVECVPAGGVQRIPKGIYGSPCTNIVNGIGTWDEAACVLRGCAPEFYYDDEAVSCVAMPEEYRTFNTLLYIIIGVVAGLIVVPVVVICFCCVVCIGGYCCKKTVTKAKKKRNLLKFRRMKKKLQNENQTELESDDDGSMSGGGDSMSDDGDGDAYGGTRQNEQLGDSDSDRSLGDDISDLSD